jgi:phosphoglycolate phosphatase
LSRVKLAVFDLDGTLVDSAPGIAAALTRALAPRGHAAFDAAEVAPMLGDGARVLMARACAARGTAFDAALVAPFVEDLEGQGAAGSAAYAGIEPALDALARAGWRAAVCTNKPAGAARALLEELGLARRFALVLGGDSLPVRKPDPAHLLGLLAALDAAPGQAVMIGDHANDIAAARGAGVRSVFAAWGYGTDTGADHVAATPAALPGLLLGAARSPPG